MTHTLPRVLFGIGGLGLGGSEKQLVELLEQTHGDTLDAHLVTWATAPDFAPAHRERLAAAGVPVASLGPFSVPRGARPPVAAVRLGRLMRTWRPDVVYPWLEEAAAIMLPIARLWRLPVVIARRNVSGARIERFAPARAVIRAVERRAQVVTCNSTAAVETAVERGVKAERILLVRNGHPAPDWTAPPVGEPVVIGCVARFRPEKGHARLVSVLSAISTDKAWRVDLAGDGPLEGQTRDAVVRAGLEERVRFLGPVDDIPQFWRQRAIAVLLSDHEGSPNALIEAALAGRAIVATDVGGTPEVVGPNGGFLVPLDDPATAARLLARLIEHDHERDELGQQARQQALERFSVANFVSGHLAALQHALNGRP